ncbi:hypothetical protein BCR44DRAFT_1239668 [Catenaria anguillulae PL171]|uniref:Uncharacterized protein n=1 Tax=Catenaria anguillulae PL171 TaxID=765915 RepID=A0A1Y2HH24_9FUNG|nr:hypothetical protein BCR44DRAFT_1239668 [Catenaria anguillulae PL171]
MPSATPSPSKQPRVHQVQTPEPSLPEWDASHGSVVAARPHSRVTKSLSPQRGRSTATGSRPVTRERPASVAHGDSSGLPSLERQSRPVTRESNGSVSRPGTRGGDQPREHNNLFSDGHLKLRAREKIYNVNLVSRGMPSYEPLLDGYLQDHFATPSIRAHLKRLGIIDSDGYIIDEREFQHMQLAMDRAEKAIQLERESQQRDLDREVEVVVRHAQDPLETQAPPRDHATKNGRR